MGNLWHKPTERPKERSRHCVYVLRKRGRRLICDSGLFIENDWIDEKPYIALVETKILWSEVYLWAYDYEFSRMIQTTFKKRQRKYHLRHESTRFSN